MAEYSYKDIIIDPTSEEAKNAVGKICYFSNSPRNILSDIYRNSAVEGILTNMDDGYFEVDNEGYWDCIILKKEEPKPKYVPFESEEEFIKAFDDHTHSDKDSEIKTILYMFGMWLKWKGEYVAVTHINENGINDNTIGADWQDLCDNYTFIDNTPCGKEVKE